MYYISEFIFLILTKLLGTQYNDSIVLESNNLVDKYGKPIYNLEYLLFDSFNFNVLLVILLIEILILILLN